MGAALQASARGVGYRRTAGVGRPLSTVRRRVRAVRDPSTSAGYAPRG